MKTVPLLPVHIVKKYIRDVTLYTFDLVFTLYFGIHSLLYLPEMLLTSTFTETNKFYLKSNIAQCTEIIIHIN